MVSDNNTFGFFPSVSLGWDVKKEGFLSDTDFITMLKLRTGYGRSGNLGGITSYTTLNTVKENGIVSINGAPTVTMGSIRNTNPDLKWETRSTFNIGFDLGIWDNRLMLTSELYYSKTTDMLYEYDVPVPTFAFDKLMANIGSMSNQGVELGISVVPIQRKDMEMNINFNMSYQKNKLLSLSGEYNGMHMTASDITPIGSLYGAGQNGGDNNVVYQIVGQPLGVFYLPHCKGLKENELGGYSYDIEDLNDDGEIDFSDGGDRYIAGQATPKVTIGSNISFRYKSFDIAMQNELTLEENMELARKFVQEQFVTKGMIADLAFHSPEKEDGGIPNPHFHVMTTMRPLNPDGTWGQKQRREYLLDEDGNRIRDKNGDYMFNAVHTTDWHEPETLEHWREPWAAAVNTKFEEKGLDVRIDHRSYVRQGLDLIPTVHEGANVRQMEAKGIRTEKGELNRWIKATNRLMQDVRKKIKALFVWMAEVKEELSKPQTPSLADLLIAYYNQRNAGAWSNKARTGNLKQFAEAVNYLTENKLLTLEDLQERLSSVNEEFEALSDSMKKKSARIKELQELIREGENYQRLKPVHTELNNIKFKKQREKFETSHDAELRLFYAARRILKEKLDGKPIALKAWKQEYAQLKTEYAELSPQHKPLREEVIRLRQVQNAVDTALRRREQPQAVQRKKHEMEL